MPKGFTKNNNLSESDNQGKDFNALNNLTNQAARDIQLFSNNNQNKSTIESSNYITDGSDVLIDAEGYLPFSNGTTVSHNNETYTVINSDGKTKFQLQAANSDIFIPSGDITRTDKISFSNISNLSATRLPTYTEEFEDQVFDNFNTQTIEQNLSTINLAQSFFDFTKTNNLLSYQNNSFDRNITTTGYIEITNTANTPLDNANAPGLYIFSNDTQKRAFSDRTNPWNEVTVSGNNYIETNADSATVDTLVLSNPNITGTSATITSSSGLIADFTHKVEVEVNGETYYLLLKYE